MFEYVTLGFCVLNFILLIGIAGSVAKLLKSIEEPVKPSVERESVDSSRRPPNYAELAISNPQLSQANWDGMKLIPRNWDGIPRAKE
jgi:hypothetical protein